MTSKQFSLRCVVIGTCLLPSSARTHAQLTTVMNSNFVGLGWVGSLLLLTNARTVDGIDKYPAARVLSESYSRIL